MIVGVDEAGRGPLAGNVVACALFLSKAAPFKLKDSKKLTPVKREAAFNWLKDHALFGIGQASPREIDELNILNASFLAFKRAIEELLSRAPELKPAEFIIDGNRFKCDLDIRARCLVKADDLVEAVSAASIVAKVTRDKQMAELDGQYPQYGFAAHKGYPTKEHYAAIRRHGPCPLHRTSFRLY